MFLIMLEHIITGHTYIACHLRMILLKIFDYVAEDVGSKHDHR